MELPAGPSSHHFTTRKPGEHGLAEWAEKIRALQRQVDQDEEEEHRKLEQEIAASRLARVRRSAGYGHASLDYGAADTPSTTSRRSDPPDFVRRGEQAEVLQKLVGNPPSQSQTAPSSPAPISLAAFIGGRATGPRLNKHAPQLDAADPALFEQRSISSSSVPHPIFGRGGIAMLELTSRSRRAVSPTPDSDHEVYSPTPTTSTRAHSPIAHHEPTSSNTKLLPVSNSDHQSGGEASRQPRTSTPSAALKRYVQHVEQAASTQASNPSFERDVLRPRTLSTPTGAHPTRATTLPPPVLRSQSRPTSPRGHVPPRSPNFVARSPPPTFDSNSPLAKSPTLPSSKPSTPAFITPKKSAILSAPSPVPGVKLPTFSPSTPSLPRQEASTPKATFLTSQRRPPPIHPSIEKDPTPSISRLKGRGFVQSMVKASSALEAAAAESAITEVGKVSLPKCSPSIATRRKPESSPSQSVTTPVPANFRKSWTPSAATPAIQRAVTQRKSWTTSEPQKIEESEHERPARALEQQNTSHSVRVIESHHTGLSTHAPEHQHTAREQSPRVPGPEPSIRRTPSLTSLSTPSQLATPPPESPGGHGLGSSSTMFSYIKPMKTGDDPATGNPHPHSRPTTPHSRASAGGLTSSQDVGELGHRAGASSGGQQQRSDVAGFPALSGRPLVHLTKGRSKPKKANWKNMDKSKQLTDTRVIRPIAPAPHVPIPGPPAQNAIAEAVKLTSPTRATPPSSTGPIGTTSLAAQLSTHAPTINPDRPGANAVDLWNGQTLIGARSSDSTTPNSQEGPFLVGSAHHLPGLSTPPSPSPNRFQAQPSSAPPRSPQRQSRIPSTGSRTLVMDVAQAFQEAQAWPNQAEAVGKGSVPVVVPRQTELHAPPIEKRKSNFDEYSGRVMPPLLEEHTSIIRGVNPEPPEQTEIEHNTDARAQKKASADDKQAVQEDNGLIEIPYHDEPLPRVDLDGLLLPHPEYQPSTDVTTMSVDVMSVSGTTTMGVNGDTNVFYDSEILAIVHRVKTKSSGLVETTLWGWQGRSSQIGGQEQRKLKDMARHYGTKLCPVLQGCEPPELVHALSGRLATRQGIRSHWSAENTTMHQVRLVHRSIFVDEQDFHVSNLCSAFSYCFTLLGTCYVWHGKGSLPAERQAALEYALSLSAKSSPVELVEQESDDDEMFWMMLGDADYARADYWKWRPGLADALPRIWRVNTLSTPHLTIIPTFSAQSNVHLSVYLLDCIWELFVLVGTKARKARREIRLALSIATDLSSRIATSRPFTPPVHVLILPSKIPLDLRQHFRDLDEEHVNGTLQPDHMNLLELSEALSDLERVRWEKTRLKNFAMLPLGIDPTCLS